MFQFLSLERFAESGSLIAVMSEKKDGSMSPRYTTSPGEWRENRLQFFEKCWKDLPGAHSLLMPGNGISLRGAFDPTLAEDNQDIHVTHESFYPVDDRGRGMSVAGNEVMAEALVLTQPGVFGCLTIADCAALMLFDPWRRIAAIAHVSRVTAFAELPQRLVRYLRSVFEVRPADLYAAISPMISPASYAFPPDVLEHLVGKEIEAWRRRELVVRIGDFDHVDLPGAVMSGLIDAGLYPEQIDNAGIDTATARDPETNDWRFFSHHRFVHPERFPEREQDEGRNMFILGMPTH